LCAGWFGSFGFAPAVGLCGWGQRQMCQTAVAKEIFKNAKRGLFLSFLSPVSGCDAVKLPAELSSVAKQSPVCF